MKFPSILTIITSLSLALLGGDLAAALPIPNANPGPKPGFWGRTTTNYDGKFNGERLYDLNHVNHFIGNDSYGNTEAIIENESAHYHHPRRKTWAESFKDIFISSAAPTQKTNLFWKRGKAKKEMKDEAVNKAEKAEN